MESLLVNIGLPLLSLDLICTSPNLLDPLFLPLTKGDSNYQSPFRLFVRTIMSFPQTAPIVDADFYPVTWHNQRRPFFHVLACKTRKTRRGLACGASSDDQVSQVFLRRGEKEREREGERIIDYAVK